MAKKLTLEEIPQNQILFCDKCDRICLFNLTKKELINTDFGVLYSCRKCNKEFRINLRSKSKILKEYKFDYNGETDF